MSGRRTGLDLAAQLALRTADPDGYQPDPPPAWWKLPAAERHEPIARLYAWVEQVYRPGYGHLTAIPRPGSPVSAEGLPHVIRPLGHGRLAAMATILACRQLRSRNL